MRTPQALRNRPWLEPAARAGYVAKGIIYALIGGLAIAQVVESAGSIGGGRNAVQTIGQQPFGQILLVIIGVGLFAYALWRAVQAIFDPEDAQSDTGGTLKRIGYGASGAVHAMLGVAAFQMALGSGGGGSSKNGMPGSGSSKKTYLAELLAIDTIGPVLVIGLGLFVIGFAVYQLYKAATLKFQEELKTGEMSRSLRKWVPKLGRFALASRGVVFAIVGVFLVKAGLDSNPGEFEGVGGALREIGSESFGSILLVLVATGLAAYGAFQVVMARYRKIPAR